MSYRDYAGVSSNLAQQSKMKKLLNQVVEDHKRDEILLKEKNKKHLLKVKPVLDALKNRHGVKQDDVQYVESIYIMLDTNASYTLSQHQMKRLNDIWAYYFTDDDKKTILSQKPAKESEITDVLEQVEENEMENFMALEDLLKELGDTDDLP